MSFNRNLLNIIIILCVCFSWDCSEGARAKQRKEIDSHTIQLNSLFPSPSSPCVLSARASNTKSSLHVTHRHGTCSRLTRGKSTSPDHAEILRLDQARVNSIHSKLSKKLLTDGVRQSQTTNLPAKHGSIYGSANYVVTVGIGTPKQDQSLIFDTGSDLTWIQCKPCIPTCYSQKEPIFNPYKSSSYKNVLCLSAECRCLYSATGKPGACSGLSCVYGIQYGDQSFSVGLLAKEKFTLTNSTVFDSVSFGCGENNKDFSPVSPDSSVSAVTSSLSLPRRRQRTIRHSPTASLLQPATPDISPSDPPESLVPSNSLRRPQSELARPSTVSISSGSASAVRN
ncbi:BnaCnng29770D [Brassica napus]|uniref:(rape) hypothetical protein n=1 Tax=Brassica napus TaxID=3708 RepID=A0A078IZQ6_BRANA|nr:unnamed protein product [Brassica napus]CDY56047.1 BnaCnng29770D [Brassica napus]